MSKVTYDFFFFFCITKQTIRICQTPLFLHGKFDLKVAPAQGRSSEGGWVSVEATSRGLDNLGFKCSTCSGTAGKYSSALCLSSLPTEQKFLTTHIAAQIISSEIAKCSGDVESRAWEGPRSWWEPEAFWTCINWNDDDRNAHFNTKTHHMVYFNISPYHLTPSFTLSMTPSLSAKMTDLFSASSSLPVLLSSSFGLCCPTFWLRSLLDYPQSLAHSTFTSHHLLLSAAGRLWKSLYSLCHIFEPNAFYLLSNACKSHLSHTTKPEVISPPRLPQHTGSHMLSCG